MVLIAGAAANCGDDVTGDTGAGGQAGAVSGSGGDGGSFLGCDECGGATPICADDVCVSACPDDRDACWTSSDDEAPAICCGATEQCCRAVMVGTDADICHPADTACPFACPDGETICADGQYCQLDAETQDYSCVDSCSFVNICDGTTCCPLGSRCDAGSCVLPDLTINAPRVAASAWLEKRSFEDNSCEIIEGCVQGSGERVLLRFDLETPNVGDGDLVLGDPNEQTDLFEYSPCHDHFHFNSYADYSLEDGQGNSIAAGHKQAFCLLDWNAYEPGAPSDPQYDCSYQGIQAGWSDVYGSGLPCQWVDVTGIAPGDYKLRVRVNYDHMLGETDYTNNDALVDVTIPAETCTGCRAYDPACCDDADSCGLGGDGTCDCLGVYTWDQADCEVCLDCPAQTSCIGGCTPNTGPGCDAGNPNGLDHNGVCDCAGAFAWDDADCGDCISNDPDCPAIDSCPNGCASASQSPPACCSSGADVCGYANDGWCDCDGAYADGWDYVDCSSCSCN
jgi:hypothetical protein